MYTLILLIVTILVFKVLFNTFGFLPNTDEEKKDEAINGFVKKISSNSDNTNKKEKEQQDYSFLKDIYNNYRNKFKNVTNTVKVDEKAPKEIDEKTEEEIFKKTSEKVVITILELFTKKDFVALRDMLTEEMYNIFTKNIKEAEEKKYNYKTVVISFDEVNIIEKDFQSSVKSVKINFKMKQINYIEDEAGNVVSGSKNNINNVIENWTFIKNPTGKFWLLKSIN